MGLTIGLSIGPSGGLARGSGARSKTDFSGLDNEYPLNQIAQYAFVVRNLEKVAAFYQRLGFGAMPTSDTTNADRIYRGRPGLFRMNVGWWNWGDYEWIQALVGPNVYEDYSKAHGEGLHHLGFNVRDIDRATALLGKKGAPVAQSGTFGDKESIGRYVYLDTEPHGGVMIELLWSQSRERAAKR